MAVVLSYLHRGHAGGLTELARGVLDVPVYVGRAHWEAFGRQGDDVCLGGGCDVWD